MKNIFFILFIISTAVFAFKFPDFKSSDALRTPLPVQPKAPGEISIMSFNVENLFDEKHDANREDFAFSPLAEKKNPEVRKFCLKQKSYRRRECLENDWNSIVIERKLNNISEVILSVDDKKGADILYLVEVENDNILSQLNRKYLKAAGYTTQVLIEGSDERGIDVALLSRFPVEGRPKLHKIPYKGRNAEDQRWMNRSRGILEVHLKLPNGSILTSLVAHFPSQNNPRYWRAQAVEYAKKIMKDRPNEMIILGGDLNITAAENDATGFFTKEFSSVGLVSHLVGCTRCHGTHFYKNNWSFLDVLVFSKNFEKKGSAPYTLNFESIDVVNYTTNQLSRGLKPKRFNNEGDGVSDHFPIYARLRLVGAVPARYQ